MSGLSELDLAKWTLGTGRQVILKQDIYNIIEAILQSGGGNLRAPELSWIDNTSVRVLGNASSRAAIMMSGFPNVVNPGGFIAGNSDGKYRENFDNTTMDFDTPTSLWGLETISQWYAMYGVAESSDPTFTLKAMPWLKVKSQTDQVISLGKCTSVTTDIGYGFVEDELVGGYIYFINGASKGLMRSISANNNSTTAGTITYDGDPLTIAQNDWFIVLPPTNFRFIGSILNNSSSNIVQFIQYGNSFFYNAAQGIASVGYGSGGSSGNQEVYTVGCPLAAYMYGILSPGGYIPAEPYAIGGHPTLQTQRFENISATMSAHSRVAVVNQKVYWSMDYGVFLSGGFEYAPGIL